jgi:hypothetical protein
MWPLAPLPVLFDPMKCGYIAPTVDQADRPSRISERVTPNGSAGSSRAAAQPLDLLSDNKNKE